MNFISLAYVFERLDFGPLLLFVIAFSAPLFAAATSQSNDMACDAAIMSGAIEQISATHATINTSILIDASVVDVWTILTDFDAIPDWSTSTLQGMTGKIRNGGRQA